MRVVIIGSGNVAEALARAISSSEMTLVQIVARNTTEGQNMAKKYGCGFGALESEIEMAELYLIAVTDKAICAVSGKHDFGDAVVAHTAGSVDIDTLNSKIKNRGVLYPLQTFTKGREVDFREVPLLIEGTNPRALKCVEEAARKLSDNVSVYTSKQRAHAHLAAVFACNFTNHMYVIAEELMKSSGMSFDLLKPLIKETAMKAISAPSPKQTQTGPAVRNDFQTKSAHTEMLFEQANNKNIYVNLSQSIWETSKKK